MCDMRRRPAMRPSVPSRLVPALVMVMLALVSTRVARATPGAGAAKPARQAAAKQNVTAKVVAKPAPATEPANDLVLKGGEEGTVFRTLTVQGEDRIHIEVERPQLKLDVDPAKAPGLDRGTVADVLDRTTPDLEAPVLAGSARDASPWVAHPWL